VVLAFEFVHLDEHDQYQLKPLFSSPEVLICQLMIIYMIAAAANYYSTPVAAAEEEGKDPVQCN
jgi:hypothetical protein